RRVLSDRLVDRARAGGIDAIDDSPLFDSLELDPEWLNAYVVLARRWLRRDGPSMPALRERLRQGWNGGAKAKVRARKFIDELVANDAFQLSRPLLDTLSDTTLVLWMNDDLDGLDVLEYERGRDGDELAFLGRVHGPRLMCSLRDLVGFPPAKRAVIE